MQPKYDFISPVEAGKAFLEAFGLADIKGVVRIQLDVQAGEAPMVTVTRLMTQDQAGQVRALLKTWELELVAKKPATERRIKADGSVGEASPPPFPSFHPSEG